ncbi:hypothetical protein GCM10010207_66770 [Streptomyces atratus]|nr:hypothetical protein GCM10010207_66770 [Streptomyces atratus]
MRLRDPRFSIPDRSGHPFRHSLKHTDQPRLRPNVYVTFARDNYLARVALHLTPRNPVLFADEDPYLTLNTHPGPHLTRPVGHESADYEETGSSGGTAAPWVRDRRP